jgi:uncharacterized protein YyaL (SSP411 family)
MGVAEELKAMADRRELDAVEPSVEKAKVMLSAADRSLKTARSIASTDPDSTLLVAWGGIAFQALAAALALAGYRVTSQPGHHRAAVKAARLLLGEDVLLSRIDRLRRTRGRGMYEGEPADKEDVAGALDDCEELIKVVRARA